MNGGSRDYKIRVGVMTFRLSVEKFPKKPLKITQGYWKNHWYNLNLNFLKNSPEKLPEELQDETLHESLKEFHVFPVETSRGICRKTI